MNLKIEFIPSSKEVELLVPMPRPAQVYIPQWYKDATPPPTEKKYEFQTPGLVSNLGIKACTPFLDALTHGYIQETWTDIHFTASSDGEYITNYNYSSGPRIIDHRDASLETRFITPKEYYLNEFVWKEPWIPKLPKGYSMLYTSPLNNFNLPFKVLDAIIDSDKYYHEYQGQNPFMLKKGFQGIIPAGTPMYLMIPIKRNNWSSSAEKFDSDTNKKRQHLLRKKLVGSYKKTFWQKKNFR